MLVLTRSGGVFVFKTVCSLFFATNYYNNGVKEKDHEKEIPRSAKLPHDAYRPNVFGLLFSSGRGQ